MFDLEATEPDFEVTSKLWAPITSEGFWQPVSLEVSLQFGDDWTGVYLSGAEAFWVQGRASRCSIRDSEGIHKRGSWFDGSYRANGKETLLASVFSFF